VPFPTPARRPLASLAEPLCTQNLTDGRFSETSCGLSKDFENTPRFLPLGMIAPDWLAKTTMQRRKTVAPMMIHAAMIAPNTLHTIALKHRFKMNIACSRNWAFPRHIDALERRQRFTQQFGSQSRARSPKISSWGRAAGRCVLIRPPSVDRDL
jgi:hypothetical protein